MIKLSERYGNDLLRLVVNKVQQLHWLKDHPSICNHGVTLPSDVEVRRWELLRDAIKKQLNLD